MFSSWRHKTKLKKFRCIIQRSYDTTYIQGFHSILLRPKRIEKIIQKHNIQKEVHNHLHHELVMHVHQVQNILQFSSVQNVGSLTIQKSAFSHSKYANDTLHLQLNRFTMNHLEEQRFAEEKKYYRYHPAKARELAMSYIQNNETKRYLKEYIRKQIHPVNHPYDIHASTMFTMISSMAWMQVLTPLIEKQSRALVHREHHIIHDSSVEHAVKSVPEDKEQQRRAVAVQLDHNALVARVVQEVERKLKQEKLRYGRRS